MATRVTNTYPGTGWVATGYKVINGVKTTIWTKKTTSTTSSSTNSSSGGSSGGASGGNGSGSSASADAKAKADRTKSYTQLYRDITGNYGGKLSKEALAFIAWASADKQPPGSTALLEWLRKKDQVGYLRTDVAQKRRADMIPFLKDIYKADWDPNNKDLKALIVKYQLGDQQKLTASQFFANYVMKNSLFKTKYGDFRAWLKKTGGDPYKAFGAYSTLRESYVKDYAAKFGAAAVMPSGLLTKAIEGNWALDGKDWNDAIAADTNWAGVAGYADRITYFNDQWAAIFGDTPLGTIPPPPDLAKKFGQTTGEPGAEFDRIFQTSIRKSTAFQTAYPDFEAYALATFKRTGVSAVNVGDYLTRRADYIERYKFVLEDPDAMPDPALLAKALASNWSNTQWDLTIEKTDPKYQLTEAAKAKAAAKVQKGEGFDIYWKSIFGENSTPDEGLRTSFVNGAGNDERALWDQIKGTSEFQSQYAQWDAFAKAQNDQGVNVMDDPGLYKQYQKAFYDAFANQGMQAPQGFDRMFFASGIDPNAFNSNVAQFSAQSGAYQWQSGQDADLATTAGIANKTAGGDLRKKMEDAVRKHQAFAQSTFRTARPQLDQTGMLKQGI